MIKKAKRQSVGALSNFTDMYREVYKKDIRDLELDYEKQQRQIYEAYERQSDVISQSTIYDISSAFHNYMTQELQLKQQAGMLGEGAREKIGSEIASAFSGTQQQIKQHGDIQQAELSGIMQEQSEALLSGYSKYMQDFEKNILEQAKTAQSLHERMLERIEEAIGFDWDDLVSGGFYDLVEPEDGGIYYNLTDKGRGLFYALLEEDIYGGFDRWLKESGYEDEYQAYIESPYFYKEHMLGLDEGFMERHEETPFEFSDEDLRNILDKKDLGSLLNVSNLEEVGYEEALQIATKGKFDKQFLKNIEEGIEDFEVTRKVSKDIWEDTSKELEKNVIFKIGNQYYVGKRDVHKIKKGRVKHIEQPRDFLINYMRKQLGDSFKLFKKRGKEGNMGGRR